MSQHGKHIKRSGGHVLRKPDLAGTILIVGYCQVCVKAAYRNRGETRKAIRQKAPTARNNLRPYRCPEREDWWHFGNLPPAVKAGERTINDPIPEDTNAARNRLRAEQRRRAATEAATEQRRAATGTPRPRDRRSA